MVFRFHSVSQFGHRASLHLGTESRRPDNVWTSTLDGFVGRISRQINRPGQDALQMGSTDVNITLSLGVLAILNLLGAAQGILLALVLLTSRSENHTAN